MTTTAKGAPSANLTAWQQAQLDRVLALPPVPPEAGAALLPEGEEMVPATLADRLERYITLLVERERLLVRQRVYDAELAKLQATGDMLAPERAALAAETEACLADLHACAAPTEAVVQEMWRLCQRYLRALVSHARGQTSYLPPTLQHFLETRYLEIRR